MRKRQNRSPRFFFKERGRLIANFAAGLVTQTFRNVASGEERGKMAVFVGYLGAFDLVPRSHYVLREIWYDDLAATQPRWGWGTAYNGIYAGGGSARKGYLF